MADYRTDAERLVDLTLQAKEKPQYQQLMEYLSLRRSVPPTKFAYLGEDTHGMYERNSVFGKELPRTGVITMNRGADANTFVHELTHAASAQLSNQYAETPSYFGDPIKPTQFTDAFQKIMLGVRGKSMAPTQQAEVMNPEWVAKNRDYRSTASELLGFAMGNSAPVAGMARNPESKVPQHLDATLATQMMILLDLAARAEKAKPQSQGR